MPDLKKEWKTFNSHFPQEVSNRVRDYVRDVVLLKSRYIFTTRVKGLQYGYCTHCRNEYRTTGLKQNEKVRCRHCESECIVKKSGLGRKHLVDYGHIVFYEKSVINPKAMVARSMYVNRDYGGDYRNVQTSFIPGAMYLFEMGNSQMWERWGGWHRKQNVLSEFNHSYIGGGPTKCPKEWMEEAITGTPFQYSMWEDFHDGDSVKFFDLYSRYPCVEYLAKLGMRYFVAAKLDRGSTYGAIDWRGTSVEKVLKLDKQRAKEFVSNVKKINNPLTLRLFQISCKEKSGHDLWELDDIANEYEHCWPLLQKMLKHTSLRRAHGYIVRQRANEKKAKRPAGARDILNTWVDYLADCSRLGHDLAIDNVLFPAKLHNAHQNTIKQVKIKEDKELDLRIREIAKTRKKYHYEWNGFLIRPAKDTKELIEEGKQLHHCVGTYAERYASGKCDILVIRRKEDPDSPFFTMEIQSGSVVQCRGMKNCGMSAEVFHFVEAFKQAVLFRKKEIKFDMSGNTPRRQEAIV
jgi:hypothetical protein